MVHQKSCKVLFFNLFLFIAFSACGGDSDARQGEVPADALRLKRFDIHDREGFQNPMVVATFLAPADWHYEGGVRWNTNSMCTLVITQMQARVSSQDGLMAFEVFPRYASIWSTDPGFNRFAAESCVVAQQVSSETFIRSLFIPGYRRGAQVISVEPLPELARAVLQQKAREKQSEIRQLNARINTDAALARIEYTQSGRQTEEWVLSIMLYSDLPGVNGFGQQITISGTETVAVFAFSAPKGELDKHKKLLDTILSSYRSNPAYTQALSRVKRNINRIAMKGAMDRAKIQQQLSRELSAIQDQSIANWKQRMARDDVQHSKYIRSIRGTESYTDPQNDGVTWDLSAGYKNVWKTANDEFILTNDVNFNPNVDAGGAGNWMKLKKQD